ncbi:MAG TPA: glycosyltransferase family 4 protein, partial [Xanthomonadaceae bacterium]|nr:glycosyltransferase family 4 protein [Xanthomonadaceae bacterium]
MPLPLEPAHGFMLMAAAFGAIVLSASATGIALIYARRRGLLDLPGQRRSHHQPTPRGGGIGILAVAFLGLWMVWPLPFERMLWLTLPVAAIGMAGWIDDHRGLPVFPRLLVQVVAALAAVAALSGLEAGLVFAVLAILGVVGSTNVMNFMDGSNGMATLQGIFLATAGMLLAGAASQLDWALWCLLLACACLGFLPFNVPRARIFLGDVGSTSLGFCLGVAGVALIAGEVITVWQALILVSAFLADAACTLAWRMWRGRRWYTAHREHTYQWLIRSGLSHLEVAAAYMAWNILLVSPLMLLAMHRPEWQPALTIGVYGLALAAWVGARAL